MKRIMMNRMAILGFALLLSGTGIVQAAQRDDKNCFVRFCRTGFSVTANQRFLHSEKPRHHKRVPLWSWFWLFESMPTKMSTLMNDAKYRLTICLFLAPCTPWCFVWGGLLS